MHVFRHNHVSVDAEPEALSYTFQRAEKCIAGVWPPEVRFPVIAAEGEEVKLTGLVKAF
jgi:hypothetical protein